MPDTTFGAVPGFDAAALPAEGQRQAAQAATARSYSGEQGPQVIADITAQQRASNIAYFRSMLAAAVATGQSTSAAISALAELGIRP